VQIIDAQSHVWDRDSKEYPWDPKFGAGAATYASAAAHYREMVPITPLASIEAMAAVKVDRAILVSPTLYGFDPKFALKAAADHPGKFGVIAVFDPSAPNLTDLVSGWRKNPHALGLRIVVMSDSDSARLKDGLYNALLGEAEKSAVPICIFPPRYLEEIAWIPKAYPKLSLIIDHLGFPQPPMLKPYPDPFERLPTLLSFAAFDNVSVKLTGVPTLSRQPFPYPDVWKPLHAIIDAFGLTRVMWGSDWTRVASVLSYAQGIDYVRGTNELSSSDKEHILGKTAERVFRWSVH